MWWEDGGGGKGTVYSENKVLKRTHSAVTFALPSRNFPMVRRVPANIRIVIRQIEVHYLVESPMLWEQLIILKLKLLE